MNPFGPSAVRAYGGSGITGGGGITIGTTSITGGADKQVLFNDGGFVGSDAGMVYDKTTKAFTITGPLTSAKLAESTTVGGGLTITTGTAVGAGVAALAITRTNNNAAVDTGVKWTIVDTLSAAGFLAFQILAGAAGATNLLSIGKTGTGTFGAQVLGAAGSASAPTFGASASPTTGIWTSQGTDTVFASAGNNVAIVYDSGIDVGATRVFKWNSASNFGGGADTGISRLSAGIVAIGTGANGSIAGAVQAGFYSTNAQVTETNATHSVATTTAYLIANRAGTITVTLPAAASFIGRQLSIRTIQAQTVVSNAANVVPLAGGAAGPAILAATAGKWAKLVSDGTNWNIEESN